MKIALFGKIRSGKDTVGKILIEEHGFKRFAFGDGIGAIIQEYFPEAWAGGKPRKHYQHIGQQLRVLNPNVWINYMLHNIDKETCRKRQQWAIGKEDSPHLNVVVTDGRQINEAERLKEEGFLIVRVVCPEEIRIERMKALGDLFKPEDLKHETELNVDRITPDVEIINDGSLNDLYIKVQKMIQDQRRNN